MRVLKLENKLSHLFDHVEVGLVEFSVKITFLKHRVRCRTINAARHIFFAGVSCLILETQIRFPL